MPSHEPVHITKPIVSDLTAEDLQWQLNTSETQTFYIRTHGDDVAYVQLAYARVGWSTTVQVSAAYFGADGLNILQTVNTGHLTLSEDKLSVSCEGLSMEAQNKEATSYTVLLTQPHEITASFTFERTHRGFKAGRPEDGRMLYGEQAIQANHGPTTCHRFYPFGKITSGTLNIQPKSNDHHGHHVHLGHHKSDEHAPVSIDLKDCRALFIHASIDGMLPYQLADHFNAMFLQTDDASLTMLQFNTPKKSGGNSVAFGCFAHKDRVVAIPLKNMVEYDDVVVDPDNGYAIPAQIRCVWEGVTWEGEEPFSALLVLKLGKPAQRIDILSHLPYFIRVIIQTLVTKPFIYQWAERVTAQVSMGEEKITLDGRAIIECSFLN